MENHSEDCFEIVSQVIPSNWIAWTKPSASGHSPKAWQSQSFYEDFFDHDPRMYAIFENERNTIVREDASRVEYATLLPPLRAEVVSNISLSLQKIGLLVLPVVRRSLTFRAKFPQVR